MPVILKMSFVTGWLSKRTGKTHFWKIQGIHLRMKMMSYLTNPEHERQKELYGLLEKLGISFEYHEHPPLATIDDAIIHWKDYNSGRCKNIFFRNHKGDRHYLVILEHLRQLDIHDLEKRLRQGKLTLHRTRG